MAEILECVPNISEGRDAAVIDACVQAVSTVPGVTFMGCSSDGNHNRSVLSFLGAPAGVLDAAVALAKTAAARIDLTQHRGEHPRMGAVDVMPLIALRGLTQQQTVEYSRQLGQRVWQQAGIPVFLYEDSATAPNRRNLADIRRGGFEGMAEKTRLPEWQPDYGAGVHPTAGVVAVGARKPLIAFNINLSTNDVTVASQIARAIRASSGGLACVKALGIRLHSRGLAQVSINMTDYTVTPLYRALELARAEARRWGVTVVGTELVGLSPMRALADSAAYYLQLENFDFDSQVLENFLLEV